MNDQPNATPIVPKVVKLSSLRADLAKEREGDWIPAPDIGPGVAFLVRSTNFPPFVAARDQASIKLAKKFGEQSVPEEETARINGNLAIEHLLLDWRGFDVPFTEEAAGEVLTDPSYRIVRTAVFAAATKVGKSDVELVEAVAKN